MERLAPVSESFSRTFPSQAREAETLEAVTTEKFIALDRSAPEVERLRQVQTVLSRFGESSS
jgi:hypothetical protein